MTLSTIVEKKKLWNKMKNDFNFDFQSHSSPRDINLCVFVASYQDETWVPKVLYEIFSWQLLKCEFYVGVELFEQLKMKKWSIEWMKAIAEKQWIKQLPRGHLPVWTLIRVLRYLVRKRKNLIIVLFNLFNHIFVRSNYEALAAIQFWS